MLHNENKFSETYFEVKTKVDHERTIVLWWAIVKIKQADQPQFNEELEFSKQSFLLKWASTIYEYIVLPFLNW